MAYIFETTSGEKIEAHPAPYSSEQIDMALGKAMESVSQHIYAATVQASDWRRSAEGSMAVISVPGLMASEGALILVDADMGSTNDVEQLVMTAFATDTWLKAGCYADGEFTILATRPQSIDIPIRIHVLKR